MEEIKKYFCKNSYRRKETEMKILITGAKGMVGTALTANLYNIKEGKNRTRPNLFIEEI